MGAPVASMSWGCMHMQTCRHADMSKTKKAKLKELQTPGFEPRTLGIRSSYNYQLSYIRICWTLGIRELMA